MLYVSSVSLDENPTVIGITKETDETVYFLCIISLNKQNYPIRVKMEKFQEYVAVCEFLEQLPAFCFENYFITTTRNNYNEFVQIFK